MKELKIQKLNYLTESPFVPIPPSEKDLQTITATPWFKVSDDALQLEGLCFDREGNLYFLEVFGGKIFKLTLPGMELTEIYGSNDLKPAALKIHKDGRLFVACLGDFKSKGCLFTLSPDGNDFTMIISEDAGYVIDDLVFDSDGGFYFTDFKGYSCEPTGGVFYVSPDYKTITPILKNMAVPNGISLSTDEKTLWVTEMSNNRLHMIELEDDRVTIPVFGTSVPFHFTGYDGPDSCCIDSDDNLYVAMYQQGKALVFNKFGYPIGQILLPGRESGHMLRSTHPMMMPDTDNLIICSNDSDGGEGSWLFIAKGFAPAFKSFQFN